MNQKESNGVLRINKYLACIVSLIVIATFIFTAFGGVMLKAARIDEHEIKIKELQERQDTLEKTVIRYEERQEQIKKMLEEILKKLEKR